MVSSSTFTCLIDCRSAINLVHPSIVSYLDPKVLPCVGPCATLADGQTTLECNAYCVVSHGIAGRSMTDTFFVISIGVQGFILGMPLLEKQNSLMDWTTRTF